MTESINKRSDNSRVEEFVGQLTPEENMLIVLKRQLYDGDWDAMLEDLSNRLAGKPYVFKLETRIKDDINRVGRLRDFEKENELDLADYVKLSI